MKQSLFALLLMTIIGTGCAMPGSQLSQEHAVPAAMIADARKLVKERNFPQAVAVYRLILHDHPTSGLAPEAKYGIAMVYVSADNPRRDYAIAIAELDEFLAQYPQDQREEEARSWRQAIKVILETRKENERLNKNIEKLKQLDVRQEEKRLGR
jgi:outer membrane protein assembly factor BamD (BamD/ComL family)